MANTNYFVVRNGLAVGNTNISATSDTIQMGQGGSVTVDPATGAFIFVPAPTATYPNPQAIILTAAGTITTTTTTGGTYVIASADAAANASASSGTSISGTSGYSYELDAFTCNGRDNSFPLRFNNQYTTVASPWNLFVALDGARQPAFSANSEPVWQSFALTARTGFTLDTTQVSWTANASGALAQSVLTVGTGFSFTQSNIAIGMLVTGTGIPALTTVTDSNIIAKTITLSSNLTATLTNSNVVFSVTNIKFSDVPVPGTVCTLEVVPGTQYQVQKVYPFRPMDIMLGY